MLVLRKECWIGWSGLSVFCRDLLYLWGDTQRVPSRLASPKQRSEHQRVLICFHVLLLFPGWLPKR